MKIKMLTYINEEKKRKAEEIKYMTGKSISELVEEGIDCIIVKYTKFPKTFDEALHRIAGIEKKNYKIENIRERINKNFMNRSKYEK